MRAPEKTLLTGTLLLAALAVAAPAGEKIVWKPLGEAILRIDDKPPKLWNVYRGDKRDERLLVQLGNRFLMLDTRARRVYELDPAKLERKGRDLLWREADRPAKPLPTSDWLDRSVGLARRISVRLTVEGRTLDLQLPQQPDLRSIY